ncbi:putative ABC transporter-like, ATP-binding domain, AAA+ ATPase domain, CDR ABC transporter [Septoria linicola]|nr:putative ABC transporter-like, ATP-binding domain, AAA+ ATPase domain, CDR ABC transporter [Septoria linicola]
MTEATSMSPSEADSSTIEHEKFREPVTTPHDDLEPEDTKTLRGLASLGKFNSQQSQQGTSTLDRYATLEGTSPDDDIFNPESDRFDLYKWIRLNMKMVTEEGIKPKRTGLAFRNVNVRGTGPALNIQSTVGSLLMTPVRIGEMHGLQVDADAVVHYNGIEQAQMMKEFKGEVIYNAENDKHFPHLTVGQTLEHAAAMRMPQHRPYTGSRQDAVEHITKVIMAVYGLSHTYNTKVGNDFIRGVSGGERKRVSIAEMALAKPAIAAWDNSTRGLDSATALKFVKALRVNADLDGSSHVVAIYQASQPIYDVFDKVTVLYEGRQVFFGKAEDGQAFFERMGWYCPPRQTTGDFLTSVTNPGERQPRPGYHSRVPRTPDEFEAYWRNSPEFAQLQREIAEYEQHCPIGNSEELQAFRESKLLAQSRHTRKRSPYTISVSMQIKLNTKRAFQRIWGDKPATVAPMVMNIIMALLIGSMYFGKPQDTGSFAGKGAVLFFAILLCVFSAISEVNALYEQRPIVEKHKSYAFYHPATEAIAGIVIDILPKFLLGVAFNVIIYFLSGLRPQPGQFFLYFLITYMATFTMAALFRTIAALSSTVSQAMTYCSVLLLAVGAYTGFIIPTQYMGDWFAWIRWINPVFYAFEILVANEYHGRDFDCATFVPSYANMTGDTFVCSTQGAVAGQLQVQGDAFIDAAFGYTYDHVWRNFGILIAFLFGFLTFYFIIVELNSTTASAAEVLLFRRGRVPAYLTSGNVKQAPDIEVGKGESTSPGELTSDKSSNGSNKDIKLEAQKDLFTWRNVTYDIEIKGEPRRLLDNVSGYVKPGTLTALMGTSGAGKTTLLDVLAQRTSIGVITGSMFVNGAPLNASFQRSTGYVQQQDLHLDTATVRESLRFSALLRQPESVSIDEKHAYVETVIRMLEMEDFADAVVGVPGEGLNVEQRKLLTIGVELAAKPKLLLFLDEPTSGLDSQSAWAICSFLRRLADNGQAVLCTIHQPSATLFAQFDRLLFLRRGGQTVYAGEIGQDYNKLLGYFSENGARPCGEDENPAEYILDVVGDETTDWVSIWRNSGEAEQLQTEIDEIHQARRHSDPSSNYDQDITSSEFAMPPGFQIAQVTKRVFQQYWRMPSYIVAKLMLGFGSGLFIGFSFYDAKSSLQGMSNILYAVFLVVCVFNNITQQIMPLFVTQRALYEVRERPSKAYSWTAFLIANMVVELPWQVLSGILTWAVFYYPVVGAGQDSERQVLILLLFVAFFIYASVFAHMCIVVMPDALTASAIVVLLFSMMLFFCGVMQPPDLLPGFWMFMYRTSPMTYLISAIATTMLHDRPIECSSSEINVFQPPSGQTCGEYMADFLATSTGVLQNPEATRDCGYCSLSVADQYLANSGMQWSNRWRDFGLVWVYIIASAVITVTLYYTFRVLPIQRKRKIQNASGEKSSEKS